MFASSFQREVASGSRGKVEELEKLAESTPFEAQQQLVQELVHGQVQHMASVLNSILLKNPIVDKPIPIPEKKRPSGLSFAVGIQPEVQVPSR
jgi:hypothetical protein